MRKDENMLHDQYIKSRTGQALPSLRGEISQSCTVCAGSNQTRSLCLLGQGCFQALCFAYNLYEISPSRFLQGPTCSAGAWHEAICAVLTLLRLIT